MIFLWIFLAYIGVGMAVASGQFAADVAITSHQHDDDIAAARETYEVVKARDVVFWPVTVFLGAAVWFLTALHKVSGK